MNTLYNDKKRGGKAPPLLCGKIGHSSVTTR